MQKAIHPEYKDIKVSCSCGETFTTRSTAKNDMTLDICSKCHPFYTGTQKMIDTEGRVESFSKRFGQFGKMANKKPAAEKPAAKTAEKAVTEKPVAEDKDISK
jgi:large subunit ribosomal protein L31